VKIWDVYSKQLATCLTNKGDILALAFSPDGNQLAVGASSEIRIWNTRTWREAESVVITNGVRVESLCFTPDGARLVAANTGDIGIWQLQERPEELDPLQRPIAPSPGQHACTLITNGRRVVHATRPTLLGSANVILQDLETGDSRPIWASKHHNVRTLAVSPDNQWLALALNAGPIEVRALQIITGLNHDPTVSYILDTTGVFALAFSPDGRLLAVGGRNGRLELWETATWHKLRTGLGNLRSLTDIAFSPDTNVPLLATSSADGTVRLWSTGPWERGGVLAWPDETLTQSVDPNWTTALHVDPQRGTYALWDLATGVILAEHPVPYPAGEIAWANISPGGSLVACALKDQSIRLWDPAGNAGQGEERWRLPPQARVTMLHFSPDGNLLFGLGGGKMWVWEVTTGREIGSARNSWCYFIYRPQFTSSQHQLAIPFGSEGEICLWDFAGSGEIIRFEGRHLDCLDLAVSPDGRTIATVNRGGTLKLWDVAARKEIGEIVGRGLGFFVVAFSPDSRRVIGGSADELKVWDIQTRREVADLSAGADSLEAYSLLFQDPDTLLVAGANGIRRLHAPSFAKIEAAESRRKIEEGRWKIANGAE
jgi:WD40 repeat protein